MKYQVIVVDPPWTYADRLKKMKAKTLRSAEQNYPTMRTRDICDLSVPSLVDSLGSLLVLWTPSPLLLDGLLVMSAWGFKQKGVVVWTKTTRDKKKVAEPKLGFGLGRLFRQAHELALVGTAGKSVYPFLKNRAQRSVFLAPNEGHSKKPENLQDSLDLMFPAARKLEMFARRSRDGWTCVGNEIDGLDIRDALAVLRRRR